MSIYKNDKLIYVAQCVDSLLKQTFKDFHVYVQYDGVVESGIEHFFMELTYIIHSGFISGYQNRYGDNLKPPTNVYHRMTA